MVDLPTVPQPSLFRRGGIVEPPKSAVTGSDVQAPFSQMAFAFDNLGKASEKTAESLAKQAGQRAVSQDDNGNVTVEQAPIIGPASEYYAHAVKVGALAKGVGQTKRDVLDLRKQFSGDSDAFLKAVGEYKSKVEDQYTKAAGPEVGTVIGRIVESTATLSYRAMLNAKRKADTTQAGKDIVGAADNYSDDIVALAEHGASDAPEFKEFVDNYKSLLKEGADNPMVPFTSADADQHADRTMARARQAAFVGQVRRAYDAGGADEARSFADTALADEKWSGAERSQLASRSEDEINALERKSETDVIERARAPLVHSDIRSQEGVARVTDGSMTPAWIDRHADAVGPENAERFRAAMTAPGASISVPAVATSLTHSVLSDVSSANMDAIDALNSGQITRSDFDGLMHLSSQVEQDGKNRPWANDLRRDVAIRQPSALPEVSDVLAGLPQGTTRGQADEAVDSIVDRYSVNERRQKVATLPVPRFAAMGREMMQGKDVELAHQKTLGAARAAQVGFADFVRQAALLDEWRDAVVKET